MIPPLELVIAPILFVVSIPLCLKPGTHYQVDLTGGPVQEYLLVNARLNAKCSGFRSKSRGRLAISIIFAVLSMLAKETGITVLMVNLLYDFYKYHSAVKRAIYDVRWNDEALGFARRTAKTLMALSLLLMFRLAMLQGSLPRFSVLDNPAAFHPVLLVKFLTFSYLAVFNFWLLLCPSTLSHDWQMGSIPLVTNLADSRNLATCAFFGCCLLLLYRCLSDLENPRHSPLFLGVLLLVIPFLPASNMLVTVGFVVAERVLYIPRLVDLAIMFADLAIMFADLPIMFADFAIMFADFAILFADLAIMFADLAIMFADFATLFADLAIMFADLAIMFADLAIMFADFAIMFAGERLDHCATEAGLFADFAILLADFAIMFADFVIMFADLAILFADLVIMFADFAILFADFAILFADFAILFADFAIMFADFAIMFADFAIMFADFVIMFADLAILFADLAIMFADFAILFADFAILFADFAIMLAGFVIMFADFAIMFADLAIMFADSRPESTFWIFGKSI
ncbi:hypothetical protein M8J77_005813 [Diaphorina citri]|nr:hypothetical protein M8J77_005813 [Diaphorina citri]